ncbi:hypothetical protein HDU97_002487 [Phlyctochytrium planicorne]|nr:hypothetical protein HDU97_002487 [Phlyctochytrium planicorne]
MHTISFLIASVVLIQSSMAAPAISNSEAHQLVARGPIQYPNANLKLVTVFKDVSAGEVCGYWIARGENGTANAFEAACGADSDCFIPGISRMGLCTKVAFPSAGKSSPGGTTCNYDVEAPFTKDVNSYYKGVLSLTVCPTGKACKIANKGDLSGDCVENTRGDAAPPSPHNKFVVAKVGEKCGTFLESEAGKGVSLVRAKCTSGSFCAGTTENPLVGFCGNFGVATATAVSLDGTCGYTHGYAAVQCAKGGCMFPDNHSLLGFCPEWTPIPLPPSTTGFPEPTATWSFPPTPTF